MVIPPPKNAVTRPQSARGSTVRDRHIAQIRSNGRMAWQVATGYNQRSRIETQIGRWKSVIGPKLKSPQLLQVNHGDQGRPESSEHNDRTRTACVRTHRLTLRLGKGRIPSPPRSMQQRLCDGRRRNNDFWVRHTPYWARCTRVGPSGETPTRLLVQSRKARQERTNPSDRWQVCSSPRLRDATSMVAFWAA